MIKTHIASLIIGFVVLLAVFLFDSWEIDYFATCLTMGVCASFSLLSLINVRRSRVRKDVGVAVISGFISIVLIGSWLLQKNHIVKNLDTLISVKSIEVCNDPDFNENIWLHEQASYFKLSAGVMFLKRNNEIEIRIRKSPFIAPSREMKSCEQVLDRSK